MPRIKTLIEQRNGAIYGIDRRRIYERPFTLLTNPPNNNIQVAANQASQLYTIPVAGAGPVEVSALSMKSTGAALAALMIQDGKTQRFLSNGGIHVGTIFGTGQLPYLLPETLFVDELRALQVQYSDESGSTNNIRIALHGTRYTQVQSDPRLVRIRQRMEAREYLSLPFFYTFDGAKNVVLTALANTVATITIGGDHYFALHTITYVSTGPFSFNLINASTGESIVDAPSAENYALPIDLLGGTPGYPFKLHEPAVFEPNQKLLLNLTDLSNSGNTIYLTLGGVALANRMWR